MTLDKNLQDYLDGFGIKLDTPYKIRGKRVTVIIENESHSGTLEHGFVHYKDDNGDINFCGIAYFAKNAELIK